MLRFVKEKKDINDCIIESYLKCDKSMFRGIEDKDGNILEKAYKNSASYTLPRSYQQQFHIENTIYKDTYLIRGSLKEKVIIYLHGGGYLFKPKKAHFAFGKKLVKETGYSIYYLVYPKAPSFHMCDVYDYVKYIYLDIVKKYGIENVILMGDSSGGGLLLGLIYLLTKEKREVPPFIAISPWLDLSCSNDAMDLIEDHWLIRDCLIEGGTIYAGKGNEKNPLASPLYAPDNTYSNGLIIFGNNDILSADVYDFEKKNPLVDVIVYENQCHVFPLIPIASKTKEAFEEIKSFINKK